MNDNPSPPRNIIDRLALMMGGFGSGLLSATVLYRHYPVSDLTDSVRVLGFVLLFGGLILTLRTAARHR